MLWACRASSELAETRCRRTHVRSIADTRPRECSSWTSGLSPLWTDWTAAGSEGDRRGSWACCGLVEHRRSWPRRAVAGPTSDQSQTHDQESVQVHQRTGGFTFCTFCTYGALFQGAHPRSQEQVCRLLVPVFLLLFLMYGGINEIRKFACLPVLRQ